MNVAVAALSRMVSCAPHMVHEAQAVTKGQMSVLTFGGRDREGEKFGAFLLDSMAGGGGASIDQDGLDGSGDYDVPRPSIANVEANEAASPILYLFRSFVEDTAGAGRMRGGATTAVGLTPHGVEGFDATLIGHGIEVPNSIGLFGGMPGSCAYHLLRPANEGPAALIEGLYDALAVMSDSATTDLGAKPGNFRLRQGGVFAYIFQGGGGYGDPIRRDPESVLKDMRLGFLSQQWAAELYGVAIDAYGAVDQEATRLRRLAIRRARLGGGTPAADPAPPANKPLPDILLDPNGHFRCSCGHDLGPASENWKTKAATRLVEPATCGPHIRLHSELRLRQFCCPACATLLELEVHAQDEQPLWTVTIDM